MRAGTRSRSRARSSRAAGLAPGGEVTFMRPCIFHSGFSIRKKQGGMKMTLAPAARPELDWVPPHHRDKVRPVFTASRMAIERRP